MKIKENALLFANSRDVLSRLNQELSLAKIQPSKYYLLPKEWIDKYKIKNDYQSVVDNINMNMMKDYRTFRTLLENEKTFNLIFKEVGININPQQVIPPKPNWPSILSNSINQNILYPKNFIPVKEEIINNYTSKNINFINKNELLYDIIIGENNIFVYDNKLRFIIFVCIYDKNNQCFVPNSLLYFKDENGINEMFKCICENHGINHFYNVKRIYINNDREQNIYDNRGFKIGTFSSLSCLQLKNIYNFDGNGSISEINMSQLPNSESSNNPVNINYQLFVSNNCQIDSGFTDVMNNSNNNTNISNFNNNSNNSFINNFNNNSNIYNNNPPSLRNRNNNSNNNSINPQSRSINNNNANNSNIEDNKKSKVKNTIYINNNNNNLDRIQEEISENSCQNSQNISINEIDNINKNIPKQSSLIVNNQNNNNLELLHISRIYYVNGELNPYSHSQINYNKLKNNIIISNLEIDDNNDSKNNNNNIEIKNLNFGDKNLVDNNYVPRIFYILIIIIIISILIIIIIPVLTIIIIMIL